MTDKEKLDLVYKKFKKLHAGLFGVKFYLDKPFPDDDRWTPWTRFIEPYLKMMSTAFDGEDIGELSAWAEIGTQEPVLTGREWYERFCQEVGELGEDKVNATLDLTSANDIYEYMVEAAKKAAGIDDEK